MMKIIKIRMCVKLIFKSKYYKSNPTEFWITNTYWTVSWFEIINVLKCYIISPFSPMPTGLSPVILPSSNQKWAEQSFGNKTLLTGFKWGSQSVRVISQTWIKKKKRHSLLQKLPATHPKIIWIKGSTPVGEVLILEAAPRGPVCLQLSSWAGGVPGQLGGNSGLLGTRWVSITGEVAGDPQDAGFSKRAGEERQHQ